MCESLLKGLKGRKNTCKIKKTWEPIVLRLDTIAKELNDMF